MSGIETEFACVKGVTWGTAVALGTGHRYALQRATLKHTTERIENEDLVGVATRGIPDEGNSSVAGAVDFRGDYRQHLIQAAIFMGTAGVPALVETGVHLHTLPFTASTAGLFLSAGIDYGVDAHGFASIKPTRRIIESAVGGYLMESIEYLGRGLDKTIDPSGWTFAVDPRNGGARSILHSAGVFRFNAQGGAALDGDDAVYPSSMRLEMSRNLGADFAQASEPNEPTPDGFAEITLTLRFQEVTAALLTLFRDPYDANTLLKGDMVYTSAVLAGATEYFKREFYLPKLAIRSVPLDITGPGKIPYEVTMSAHLAVTDPTGFPTGATEEVTERWQNTISTNPLA